ncbi:MAG: AMP-binding protein, partial [Bacteroidota bacterium]
MIYLLQHTIRDAAAAYPDKVSFCCGEEEMTYHALAERTDRLAAVLQQQGVLPGDRVGILLHRSLETAVAIYGILKAGAVFVPLNPKAPADYNAFVLKDCGIEILITHPSQRRNVQKLLGASTQVQTIVGESQERGKVNTISWEEVNQTTASPTAELRQVETDLAYIIYTSGSTGQPKGIMHSHASGLAFVRNAVDLFGLSPDDRFGNHAPIFFDVSQLAYFAAPFVGATAIIATDAETIFPRSLSQMIARQRPTVWYSVPLALSQMLNAVPAEELDFSALEQVFYAGEPLAPKYARELKERYPKMVIGNLYGPAETNVCTCFLLSEPPLNDDPIPIGEVWQNTDRLIVDENDKEV